MTKNVATKNAATKNAATKNAATKNAGIKQSIGVAVIGAGMAGRAHAAGYRSAGGVFDASAPDVRLVAIADINDELAEDTRRRYGFERTEHDWRAIVESDDID